MSALIVSNIVALFYLSFAGSNTLLLADILESVSLWIGAIIIYFGEYFLIFTGIGAIRELKKREQRKCFFPLTPGEARRKAQKKTLPLLCKSASRLGTGS
jgi:hypothetical protein